MKRTLVVLMLMCGCLCFAREASQSSTAAKAPTAIEQEVNECREGIHRGGEEG